MTNPSHRLPPPLAPGHLGDPVVSVNGGTYGYVARASAYRQAIAWNAVLADDPFIGPATGLMIGVSPLRVDRRYPLVWVAIPSTD